MNPPQLQWKPLKNFPGEYECRIGCLLFAVSECGAWDVSVEEQKHSVLVTIAGGNCKRIAGSKQKCQQWLTKHWHAMSKLSSR